MLPDGSDVEIFEARAFAAGPPVWDALMLASRVVECCGRLPLTLKVSTAYALKCIASMALWTCNYSETGIISAHLAHLEQCYGALQVMGAHLSSLRGHEHEQEMWHEALVLLKSAEELSEGQELLFQSLSH